MKIRKQMVALNFNTFNKKKLILILMVNIVSYFQCKYTKAAKEMTIFSLLLSINCLNFSNVGFDLKIKGIYFCLKSAKNGHFKTSDTHPQHYHCYIAHKNAR